MSHRTSRAARQHLSWDVGTLWTMRHDDHTARCALFAHTDDWELRVIIDGAPTLTQRCDRSDQAFALAEQWKGRLVAQAWRQILPPRPLNAAPR